MNGPLSLLSQEEEIRPTDIKEIQHYLILVYKHHIKASKKLKIYHIKLDIFQ